MRYLGGKERLLGIIASTIERFHPQPTSLADLFGGTGAVGRAFQRRGVRIVASDTLYCAYVLLRGTVGISSPPAFRGFDGASPEKIVDLLDRVADAAEGADGTGFCAREYAPSGQAGRQYFTDRNAKRIDAVRDCVQDWYNRGEISTDEYFYVLAGILEGAARVANIAGTYGAFLKHWDPRTANPFHVTVPEVFPTPIQSDVVWGDAATVATQFAVDVAYLDPPYNDRDYAPNYHVLETIARWDAPQLYGRSGLRSWQPERSAWSRRATVGPALTQLIDVIQSRLVVLSYNSEGLLSEEQILAILGRRGPVEVVRHSLRRYRSDADRPSVRAYAPQRTVEERLYCLRVTH